MEDIISKEEGMVVAEYLGIEFRGFTIEEFVVGLNIELEHGTKAKENNITDDDIVMTAKIVMAHINEFSNYYKYLPEFEVMLGEKLKSI